VINMNELKLLDNCFVKLSTAAFMKFCSVVPSVLCVFKW